jgi:hypothetical protein
MSHYCAFWNPQSGITETGTVSMVDDKIITVSAPGMPVGPYSTKGQLTPLLASVDSLMAMSSPCGGSGDGVASYAITLYVLGTTLAGDKVAIPLRYGYFACSMVIGNSPSTKAIVPITTMTRPGPDPSNITLQTAYYQVEAQGYSNITLTCIPGDAFFTYFAANDLGRPGREYSTRQYSSSPPAAIPYTGGGGFVVGYRFNSMTQNITATVDSDGKLITGPIKSPVDVLVMLSDGTLTFVAGGNVASSPVAAKPGMYSVNSFPLPVNPSIKIGLVDQGLVTKDGLRFTTMFTYSAVQPPNTLAADPRDSFLWRDLEDRVTFAPTKPAPAHQARDWWSLVLLVILVLLIVILVVCSMVCLFRPTLSITPPRRGLMREL